MYSLHKTSTRRHIETVCLSDLGARRADVLAELRYDLPRSYRFHRDTSRDIAVDVWRVEV